MERWRDRVAVISGASAGLGADIVIQLAKHGMKVVGLARRKDRVESLVSKLPVDCPGKIYALECDVAKEDQVIKAFEWIEKNLGGIAVLINNAGVIREAYFQGKGDTKGWKDLLDINVLGLSLCCRYGLENMLKHKIDDGHIINMNSACGHIPVVSQMLGCSMYYASKHAVTVLTDGLRKELVSLKSKIRVCSLSPGAVRTDILEVSGMKLDDFGPERPYLDIEHITSAVLYILSVPPIVNITEMIIKPVLEDM